MRYIVAGGRDFSDHEWAYVVLEHELSFYSINEIVSGGARGADRIGEMYADEYDIPLKIMRADWDRYKKSAGYIRNQEMARYADGLIAFWDGESKGTKHMIDIALREGLEVHVYRY